MTEPLKPLPVHGYTEQDDWRVQLVNSNKIVEEGVMRQIDAHAQLPDDLDQRCIAVARTKVQEAFMWLNRAVFRPQRLKIGQLDRLDHTQDDAPEIVRQTRQKREEAE